MPANELRGEIDLELEGERFVLRPSYGANLEVEKATGKSLLNLLDLASEGQLTLTDTAIAVTTYVKAWGKASDNQTIQAIKVERMGELIMEFGLLKVQLRLQLVLARAITGGCKADGTERDDPDAGEAEATGTTATPVAPSQE